MCYDHSIITDRTIEKYNFWSDLTLIVSRDNTLSKIYYTVPVIPKS